MKGNGLNEMNLNWKVRKHNLYYLPDKNMAIAKTFIANISRSMIKQSWIANTPIHATSKNMNPIVYKTWVAMKKAENEKTNITLVSLSKQWIKRIWFVL